MGEGTVDPRWGQANRVAVADVADGKIVTRQDAAVSWGRLHDEGTLGTRLRLASRTRSATAWRGCLARWA
jgi:hypothetical protein